MRRLRQKNFLTITIVIYPMQTRDIQTTFLLTQGEIKAICASDPIKGKNMLEPLKSKAQEQGLPFNILEDHQVVNEAEIHLGYGDLWCCLEGNSTFIYGGSLVNSRVKVRKDGTEDANELLAKEISGGTEIILKPGDWLWVPAGQPHQHSCASTARLMIIKIPVVSIAR